MVLMSRTHAGNDTVEDRACVAETVLARRKLAEVASSQRNDVVVELEDDTTKRFVIRCDIKLEHGCISFFSWKANLSSSVRRHSPCRRSMSTVPF
jgi:hypothetical protein